jgi:hypothetical protein
VRAIAPVWLIQPHAVVEDIGAAGQIPERMVHEEAHALMCV